MGDALDEAIEKAAVETQRVIEGWMNYDDEDWTILARAAILAALPSLAEHFAQAIEHDRRLIVYNESWIDGMTNAAGLVRALGQESTE